MNKIPLSDIILDETIYPREKVDHKRVGIFTANIRDGFRFDPILAISISAKKPKLTARRAYPRCQRKSIWFLRIFLL